MDFEKDVRDSIDHARKIGIGSDTFVMTDEEGLYDIAWQKFNSRNWWILLIPISVPSLAQGIEMNFYPPKTPKNKGFEITFVNEYLVTLVFCHKQHMNAKQLTWAIEKYANGIRRVPSEKRDFITIMAFYEKETQEWIKKIEIFKNDLQTLANTTHEFQ